MNGGLVIPQNPQAVMARRPKPEDAASHITVRSIVLPLIRANQAIFQATSSGCRKFDNIAWNARLGHSLILLKAFQLSFS